MKAAYLKVLFIMLFLSFQSSVLMAGTSDFSYSDTCYASATSFNITSPAPDSVRWDFGDINSGIANFGSGPFSTHIFSNATSYTVTMIAYTGGIGDTCRKTIQILDSPQPNLGSDFNICEGTTQLLNPGSFTGPVNYLWSDGSSGVNYVIDSTEQVIVTITDAQGCVGIDTVNATWIQIPDVNLGANASYCQGQTITLNAFWPNATYLWQDGSTNSSLVATTTGSYIAEVSVAGCTGTDQVDLIFDPVPFINFGNDTTLCKGIPLFLDATTPNANYTWQDGSTNAYYFITDPGTYSVNVQVGNCVGRDTIVIDQQEQPIVELGEDTILCYGQPYLLDAYNYGATYQWSNGANTSTIQPNQPAQYYVLAQNQCGSDADSVNVILEVCNCFVYIPTAFSPNRDNKNETFNYAYNCTDFTANFTIYNRLGQVVFTSENPDIAWDGTFNGKEAPEGVYYYVLKYNGYDSGSFIDIKKKGHVSLVR